LGTWTECATSQLVNSSIGKNRKAGEVKRRVSITSLRRAVTMEAVIHFQVGWSRRVVGGTPLPFATISIPPCSLYETPDWPPPRCWNDREVRFTKKETRSERNSAFLLGGPIGIRTRVSALRGMQRRQAGRGVRPCLPLRVATHIESHGLFSFLHSRSPGIWSRNLMYSSCQPPSIASASRIRLPKFRMRSDTFGPLLAILEYKNM
jgi:hypothetical protein